MQSQSTVPKWWFTTPSTLLLHLLTQCCTMDQERVGANCKCTDVSTVIEFHVLLGIMTHQCHICWTKAWETMLCSMKLYDGRWIAGRCSRSPCGVSAIAGWRTWCAHQWQWLQMLVLYHPMLPLQQPEILEHGIIFLQDNAEHQHIIKRKIFCRFRGAGTLSLFRECK
jgi:hypothetical protein